MNDIVVKQHASHILVVDPQELGSALVDWPTFLAGAVASFSLYDAATGCYVVANQPASILAGGVTLGDATRAPALGCAEVHEHYYLSYTLGRRETRKSGLYLATFQLQSLTDETVLMVPARREIQVFIIASAGKPSPYLPGKPTPGTSQVMDSTYPGASYATGVYRSAST